MATQPKTLKAAPPGGRGKTAVKAAPAGEKQKSKTATKAAKAPAKKAAAAPARKTVAKPKTKTAAKPASKAPAARPASKWGRVLVTGGNGFIGSELVKALVAEGAEVLAPVRPGSERRRLLGVNAQILDLDISQTDALEEHMPGLDYVFHVAGVIKGDEDAYYRINADLTETLARNALEANPKLKRYVFVSSVAATGPSIGQLPRKEEAPNNPTTDYGKSKLQGEARLRNIEGLPYTIVRPPPVLGAGDDATLTLFKIVNAGVTFGVLGVDRQLSFIDVRDLVKGIMMAARSPKALSEAFHFTHESTMTLVGAQEEIARAMDKKTMDLRIPETLLTGLAGLSEKLAAHNLLHLPFDRSTLSNMVDHHWIHDAGKARHLLGWEAGIGLRRCIEEAVVGYRDQGLL